MALSCSAPPAPAADLGLLRFLFLLEGCLFAGVVFYETEALFFLPMEGTKTCTRVLYTSHLRSLTLSIKCCSLGCSEACSMGILSGFVSRALTVLLLPPKSMIKVKLNSQLPLRMKHHPFPFLSLPEVTWISGDSVIKKNRVVQTAFPLPLLQASGRSSCSFAHLFLLSPISHQLLRISSFLGL